MTADARDTATPAALMAAGVPPALVQAFRAVSDDIIAFESGWEPRACAETAPKGSTHRPLGDGASPMAARGLAQLTPWVFDQYRIEGTSTDIYDPVASIAALWRFIAANFSVNLTSGEGLQQFHTLWSNNPTTWSRLTTLKPFSVDQPGTAS